MSLLYATQQWVLLDNEALGRSWVRREVNLLMWRRALGDRLKIVPVLLDDIAPSILQRQGFGELADLQFLLSGKRGMTPAEVAQEIANLFADLPDTQNTSMERWLGNIEGIFSQMWAPERLFQTALALGVSKEDAGQVLLHGGCRFLAHQFLGRSINEATLDAFDWILFQSQSDMLRQLLVLISPTWVDHAATLPLLKMKPRHRFVAILNSRTSRTATHYVQRATCLDSTVRHEHVATLTGEDGAAEIYLECEKAVLRLLGGDPLFHRIEDMAPHEIRDGLPKPAFLTVDGTASPMAAVAEAVSRILSAFEWLRVIILVGNEIPTPEMVASWRLGDATVLKPFVDQREEVVAHRTLRHLRLAIDNASGGYC